MFVLQKQPLDYFYKHNVIFVSFCYFLPVCEAVGVNDTNKIPDARMTASTYYSSGFYPYFGRLNANRGAGAWEPKTRSDRTDYLQVDMGVVRSVCAVATQGRSGYNAWIPSYKLRLSTNGVTWNRYKENQVEKVSKYLTAGTDQSKCYLKQ